MISIRRSDRFAIHIEFDHNGAKTLLTLLQRHSKGSPNSIHIEFDRGVTKKKRFAETTPRNLILKSGADEISEFDNTVELSLDVQTIEYFKQRLEECAATKNFFPAELCELFVKGRNATNHVYCILKHEQM